MFFSLQVLLHGPPFMQHPITHLCHLIITYRLLIFKEIYRYIFFLNLYKCFLEVSTQYTMLSHHRCSTHPSLSVTPQHLGIIQCVIPCNTCVHAIRSSADWTDRWEIGDRARRKFFYRTYCDW